MGYLSVCVEETVDQSTVGPWPSSSSSTAAAAAGGGGGTVKCVGGPSLPAVDNLVIDNMDDLPTLYATTTNDVSQLSKTLIEFLLTR